MRGLFNDTCSSCQLHRPRCAVVHMKTVSRFPPGRPVVLCDVCRRGEEFRGRFKADGRHK